ncbi:uncharacterized protein LOC117171073 [Belonocnema kinseyi]|uniref:uncharacterized protein LOC117171073 n=1 Tax=Belonocnema kinseyi TaxID=2817044 RepID=UPI00143D4741|nr:uncharacterized protein LOC117171073 [Belonocnema kinseyi]
MGDKMQGRKGDTGNNEEIDFTSALAPRLVEIHRENSVPNMYFWLVIKFSSTFAKPRKRRVISESEDEGTPLKRSQLTSDDKENDDGKNDSMSASATSSHQILTDNNVTKAPKRKAIIESEDEVRPKKRSILSTDDEENEFH